MIDLFDPKLPIVSCKKVNPGEQAFLLDINRVANKKLPQVLASSSREEKEKRGKRYYSYVTKSPSETSNISRVLLPACPKSVKIDGKEKIDLKNWDKVSCTYLIEFENNPDGVNVRIEW